MDPAILIQALFATGILSLVNCYLAWHWGFFSPLKRPFLTSPIVSQVLGAFVIYLAMQALIVPACIGVWFKLQGQKVPKDPISMVQYTIAGLTLGAVGVVYAYRQFLRGLFQGSPREMLFGMVSWLVAGPVAFFVAQLIEWVMLVVVEIRYEHQVVIQHLHQLERAPVVLGLLIGVVVLVAPLIEEFLFRGILQSWLRRHLSLKSTFILTSLLFASFHFSTSQGWSNVQLLTSLFTFSFFLCWLYERQKSLWAPIGLHIIFNLIGVLFIFYGD